MAKVPQYTRHGSSEAWALHSAHPAVDWHADPLIAARLFGYDLRKAHPQQQKASLVSHVDIPRLLIGGVGVQFHGLVSLPIGGDAGCFAAINEQLDILETAAANSDGLMTVCRDHDEMVAANANGQLVAVAGVEGAHSLRRIDDLEHLARRGVRYLGLSHFSANRACFPCVGWGRDDSQGLTRYGRQLVERCFQLGVIVDLAHINKRGFLEVCAMARKAGVPVIDSHTGVVGACRHVRNIDDDQLKALADTGGVAGVIFARAYLGQNGDVWAVVHHLKHMIRVMGGAHMALGGDFDGFVKPVRGLEDVSRLPNLTDALLREGWSPYRIAELLRTNSLRVLKEVRPFYRTPVVTAAEVE